MAVFKHLLTRGVYHIQGGARDFESWSHLMLCEEGYDVNPHLDKIFQWSLVCVAFKAGPQKLKKNCWEFYGCKTHRRKNLLSRSTHCPAYIESRLHGIHGGRNGGRACWITATTFCRLNMKKTHGAAVMNCQACDFYRLVMSEEGVHYIIPLEILKVLVL